MRKMLPHCVWCLCVFFVSCDKRGSRSISKQYTYNKQQREAEKEGGESLEENSNSRSCDSSADSLAFPFSAQDSLFCLPLSRFIGGHCSHFTPKPQFSAPSESFFNPTLPRLCVSLPHAADVSQNGTRHVASGPKSHLCPVPFALRLYPAFNIFPTNCKFLWQISLLVFVCEYHFAHCKKNFCRFEIQVEWF